MREGQDQGSEGFFHHWVFAIWNPWSWASLPFLKGSSGCPGRVSEGRLHPSSPRAPRASALVPRTPAPFPTIREVRPRFHLATRPAVKVMAGNVLLPTVRKSNSYILHYIDATILHRCCTRHAYKYLPSAGRTTPSQRCRRASGQTAMSPEGPSEGRVVYAYTYS